MITASVDRLAQAPARLRFVFGYDAASSARDPTIAAEFAAEAPRSVVLALAAELASSGPLDSRDAFRAAAQRVRDITGQKGRALLHPIRVALTGATDGPELDLAVPAIERGARLPESAGVVPIPSCAARAAAFVVALG